MRSWVVWGVVGWFAFSSLGQAESISVKGSARVRAEAKSNHDFDRSSSDYVDFMASRLRLDMHFQPRPNLGVFIQPQFTKYWGQQELNLTTVTPTASSDITSGGTNDTLMDVHQAFIQYAPLEHVQVYIGRKQLSFGDELLVGALDWHNTGRSFDVALASWDGGIGIVNVWSATLVDANITSAGVGEKALKGAYWATSTEGAVKAADLYVMDLVDPTSTALAPSVTSWGGRVKLAHDFWDLRAETTHQDSLVDAHQIDVEMGLHTSQVLSARWSFEYFQATPQFNQLFPTVHKWLGIADMFGRRNIKGYRLGFESKLSLGWLLRADYHWFQRQDVSAPAYALNGLTGYGSLGDDGAIAEEFDLIMSTSLNDGLLLELGAAIVSPSEYLKANGKMDQVQFGYMQLKVEF